MIKSLQLGTLYFSNNLIQGPLAGVSCAPFRALTWRYSQPAFSCTEMLSCKTLINNPLAIQQRYIKKDRDEGPVCFQLSANTPHELAHATQIVTAQGADLIDLNCGCPVKKIRQKGAGSSLLANPVLLYKLICAMKNNTHVPVSIKSRSDGQSSDRFNQSVAEAIRDAGADFVIVHGRHWTEHYETPCQHEQIRFFVDTLKIPVIGNGDIACTNSLKKMFATGCAGAMISRRGVGQPWLIRQLITEMEGHPFSIPPSSEIGAIFIEHIERLAILLQNERMAILQARKLAKYYARPLVNRLEFCNAIHQATQLNQLRTITENTFK
jgi:tRNA-dihydrouridine synthase B